METSTGKGRGRPRKAAPVPNNADEGSDASNVDSGVGKDGGIGVEAQANASGSGKAISFVELIEIVKSKNSHIHRISCVIHPDSHGVVTTDNLGNIRTEKGEAGYQLNTGEIIKI